MNFDLHIRKLDLEIYKRLVSFGYKTVFVEENHLKDEDQKEISILEWKKFSGYSAKIRKPKPILHTSVMDFKNTIELIKKYPNRVMCVETDLKELREIHDKATAIKNLTKFSIWLSKRRIPLLFSSGASKEYEIVPPLVLKWTTELISPEFWNRAYYRRFVKFLEGLRYG